MPETLLQASGVTKRFGLRRSFVPLPFRTHGVHIALDNIDIIVNRGEILSLIGESGSGKSTLALALLRLIDIDGGAIHYAGKDISHSTRRQLGWFRRRAQMVFQDTGSSLNPSKTVGRTIEEVPRWRDDVRATLPADVGKLLSIVGLAPELAARLPHELSGGQRQRVGIARALAMKPELLVADEPVSALDVSLQAQILNLLSDLRRDLGLTLIIVSHDLAVVSQISDRIAVMHHGRMVEAGKPRDVLLGPRHPYTRELIDAVPKGVAGRRRWGALDKAKVAIPASGGGGCSFAGRCPFVRSICREVVPVRQVVAIDHEVSCHFPGPLGGV